ncbi:MAG: hypothetical protein QOE90_1583 [Thermoplasmata archaeon]|jgi:hypothetical protein|nr:hypothetical protein [Thermoplasmata archaeon]
MASAPPEIATSLGLRVGIRTAGENVVFFGNNLGVECQRCGAYNQTTLGHKYCAHVSCPIALREFKRRKRKRTSSLEKVYLPKFRAASAALHGSPEGQDDVQDAVAEGGERSVFVDGSR